MKTQTIRKIKIKLVICKYVNKWKTIDKEKKKENKNLE